jgi:hypothetical protein
MTPTEYDYEKINDEQDDWLSSINANETIMCNRGHNLEASDFVFENDMIVHVCDECKSEWELSFIDGDQ